MINQWHRSAVTVALCVSATVVAQSADERKEISKLIQTDELARLAVELQAKFERDEARVFAYLSKHPEHQRSFEKNGSTYYLARMDAEGNPVYITAKSAANSASRPTNRSSAEPIKAISLPGEGSR